jgi:putative CocE/NonD family hydrolase
METGLDREPPVRYFVMGGQLGRSPADLEGRLWHGGRWESADQWPPPDAAETALFLQADGSLATDPPDVPADPTRYSFDPRNPVPTTGGSISAAEEALPSGGFDQRGQPGRFHGHHDTLSLASRPDVLSFESDPFDEPFEIAGPVEVVLYASSSAVDTDFTAKLLDVYPHSQATPGGYELNLADSILRARYRNGFDREEFLEPDEVYEFRIVLYPTANRFAPGHRLRVDISSSNYPRFDANPNTGEPLGVSRRVEPAHQAVYHDPNHPSRLLIHARPVSA